jgi:ABC-type lipoprotein release transport system permease subunit
LVTSIGVTVGLTGAALLTRLLAALLFQVQPLDALSFLGAPLILLPLATLASLLPALRASAADPAGVLRGD